jgi:tetratricopeptide (TPR) repeat protein
LAVEQPLNERILKALQSYAEGDFPQALQEFSSLPKQLDHPQLKLCQAVAAYQVGRLELAVQLFNQVPAQTWSCYEQEVFLHIEWPKADPSSLLEAMKACKWDSPQLQAIRHYLETGRRSTGASSGNLENDDLLRDRSKDWVVHPMFRLTALHKVRLRVFYHPALDIADQLNDAIRFFQRELPCCPEFVVQMEALEGLEEHETTRPELNTIGATLQHLAKRLKPWEYALTFSPQSNWALSSGVARHSGRLASLQVGHLVHHRALVIAHELGHLLLDLPDIPSTASSFDELSLMSSDWDLCLEATHLENRSKAACLTPIETHQQVLLGKKAEKLGDFRQALRHYQRGFEYDRWHLALGLAQLRVLKILRKRKQLDGLAEDLVRRFPLPEFELRILGLLETAPASDFRSDPAAAARTLLAQGRPRLARSFLKMLPPEVTQGAEMLGCRAWSDLEHWRPSSAHALASDALQQAPGHFKLHELLGLVQLQLGQYQLAQLSLHKAAQLQGRRLLPKIYRYYLDLASSKFEKAARYLKDIQLKRNPADESSWNQLGLIQVRLGEFQAAEFSFSKAVGLKATAYNRACLALAQGRDLLAKRLALQAARQPKSAPPAWELLAYLEPNQAEWIPKILAQVPGYVVTLPIETNRQDPPSELEKP